MSALAILKHRSASSQLGGASWEFSPAAGFKGNRILARVVLGAAQPIDLDIEVCSLANPKAGCWVVTRAGVETWRVMAAKMPNVMPFSDQIVPRAMPFYDGMPVGSIDQLCCPPNVQAELEAL